MKQLQMKYHTSAGKSKTLSVNYVDQNLTGEQVKKAMGTIAASKSSSKTPCSCTMCRFRRSMWNALKHRFLMTKLAKALQKCLKQLRQLVSLLRAVLKK